MLKSLWCRCQCVFDAFDLLHSYFSYFTQTSFFASIFRKFKCLLFCLLLYTLLLFLLVPYSWLNHLVSWILTKKCSIRHHSAAYSFISFVSPILGVVLLLWFFHNKFYIFPGNKVRCYHIIIFTTTQKSYLNAFWDIQCWADFLDHLS